MSPTPSVSPGSESLASRSPSYGQILKSSSIVGGAQGINYVIGLVRTKIVAVLLGPTGVGLVGLYMSIISLAQTMAQLGIDQSGVREVAEAAGGHDEQRIAKTVRTLRRLCWLTGILGWLLTASLSWLLTKWTFGSTDHVWAVAILGSVVLLEIVAGGERALLQGLRRISDLAGLQVASAALSTVLAIATYTWLGERGIVPVIILTSVVQLGCSWFLARRVSLAAARIHWSELWIQSRPLVALGSSFMYGALLAALAALLIRSFVMRELGLDAAGIYQAAWALSGIFAGFILQAMGADFYPRLTSMAQDNVAVNRLVNEQIEVGMVLALPGIIGGIIFAPWLMQLLYSAKFIEGSSLLAWFVIGVFGQVATWPLGIIQTAKAATGWIYFSRTFGAILQLVTAWVGMRVFGLWGIALGFAVYVWIQGALATLIACRLSAFTFTRATLALFAISFCGILLASSSVLLVASPWNLILASACGAAASYASLWHMRGRLPDESRLARVLSKVPGLRLYRA